MKIEGNKFVITGGISLIGSHISEELLKRGAREVVLFDNYSLGSTDMIQGLLQDKRIKVVRGDILRINELYDAFEDAVGVFSVAAFLTLPLSQNPALGLAVNVQGQVNVFEACRYRGVKKVIFSSSIAVYGEPGADLIKEETPSKLAPFSPAAAMYAATKLIGENLCQLYHQKHKIQTIALRYSTVYGERQHYRGVNALYIVENYDRIARGERPTIPDDGSEVHDYVHVSDVARANVTAMASEVSGEIFNVASGVSTSLNDLVGILLKVTESKLTAEHKSSTAIVRASKSSHLDISLTKIEKMLNWKPQVGIEEGVRRLVAWRRNLETTA